MKSLFKRLALLGGMAALLATPLAAQAQTVVPSYQEQATGNVKAGIGVTVLSGGSGGGAVYGPDAQGAATTQPPVQEGCIYNSTPPTVTTGQVVRVQCDANGQIKTAISGTALVAGDTAPAAADSGWPVKIGCKYQSTLPTYANGQRTECTTGTRGSLNTTLFDVDSNQAIRTYATNADGVTAQANAHLGQVGFTSLFNGSTWDRARSGGTTGSLSVSGGVAGAAADGGNPVKVGCVYNSTTPTYTTGQRTDCQADVRGNIRTELMNADGTAGAVVQAPTDGTTNANPGLVTNDRVHTFNGTTWDRALSIVNATNSTGTGIQAVGLTAQLDDTSPTAITENQFGNLRIDAERKVRINSGTITNPSITYTRPADTTAYSTGDLIANSTTAGSVVVQSFSANADGWRLGTGKLYTNITSGYDSVTILVDLWSAAPTFTNGDNGAYAPATSGNGANFIGQMNCVLRQLADGATGNCNIATGFPIAVTGVSTVYATMQIQSSPATNQSAKTFTFVPFVENK